MKSVSFVISLLLLLNVAASAQSQTAEQYNRSGLTKKAKGDLEGAISDYNKAIELNPRFADAYSNRGVARKARGDLDGAIADYDRAIKLSPNLKEPYNNRGLAQQLRGNLDAAIDDFHKALRIDPNFAGAHYNLASAARAKGDLKLAFDELTKAIASPDNDHLSQSYNNRGTIRHEQGDNLGALVDYSKAIKIDPLNVLAYANRGYALILLGRDNESQTDFDQVLKLRPGSKAAVDESIKNAKEERAGKRSPEF